MKVQGKIPLVCEEHTIFAVTVAETLIGQTTADGWVVIRAENEDNQKIWLIVEKDIEENNDQV